MLFFQTNSVFYSFKTNSRDFYSTNDMFAPNNVSAPVQAEIGGIMLSSKNQGTANQPFQQDVLDRVKMQGVIMQYYLEQLPDNTYKLRQHSHQPTSGQNQSSSLFFSEFYKFTPLKRNEINIAYLSYDEFSKLTKTENVYDRILSQLYQYESNFILSLSPEMDSSSSNQTPPYNWYYSITDSDSFEKRVVWQKELFEGYNILHIKELLYYFEQEVDICRMNDDRYYHNWKINTVSVFEALVQGVMKVVRSTSKATCERLGFDHQSIFGVFRFILSSNIIKKVLRIILHNNLADAGNIMKVIKGFYVEFNEIDFLQLPESCRDPKLAEVLPPGIDSLIRLGKTEYYIHKHMLVIRLNVAFVSETFESNKMTVIDSQTKSKSPEKGEQLRDYTSTVANAFDFFEQLFTPDQIVCQILNKLEIDNHMLAISKQLSLQYSQSITLNINYESLFRVFKQEFNTIKDLKNHILKIKRYETIWHGLTLLRECLLKGFSENFQYQLQSKSYQELFQTVFINLLYSFETRSSIGKRLQSNLRTYPLLKLQVEPVEQKPQTYVDLEEEQELSNKKDKKQIVDTILKLDLNTPQFNNTFLVMPSLSDFIMSVQVGNKQADSEILTFNCINSFHHLSSCLIGYTKGQNDCSFSFGCVKEKTNTQICLNDKYMGRNLVTGEFKRVTIPFEEIAFAMINFTAWPNPTVFKPTILQYAIIDAEQNVKLINSRALADICGFYLQDASERNSSLAEEYEMYLFRGSENFSSTISLTSLMQLMPQTISIGFESADSQQLLPSLMRNQSSSVYQNNQKMLFKFDENLNFKIPDIHPQQLSFASQVDAHTSISEDQMNLIRNVSKILEINLYDFVGEDQFEIEFEYDNQFEYESRPYLSQLQRNSNIICTNISDAIIHYVNSLQIPDDLLKFSSLLASTASEFWGSSRSFNEMKFASFLSIKVLLKHVERLQVRFEEFTNQKSEMMQLVSYEDHTKCLVIHVFLGKKNDEAFIPSHEDILSGILREIVTCEVKYLAKQAFRLKNKDSEIAKKKKFIVNSTELGELKVECTAPGLSKVATLTQPEHKVMLLNLMILAPYLRRIRVISAFKEGKFERIQVDLLVDSSMQWKRKDNNGLIVSFGLLSSLSSTTLTSGSFTKNSITTQFLSDINGRVATQETIDANSSFLPSSFIKVADLSAKMSEVIEIHQFGYSFASEILGLTDTRVISSSYEVMFVDLDSERVNVVKSQVDDLQVKSSEALVLRLQTPNFLKQSSRFCYVVFHEGQAISMNFIITPTHKAIETMENQSKSLKLMVNETFNFFVQEDSPQIIQHEMFDGISTTFGIKDDNDSVISLKSYAIRYEEFLKQTFIRITKPINKPKVEVPSAQKAFFKINTRYVTNDILQISLTNSKSQYISIKSAVNNIKTNSSSDCADSILVDFVASKKVRLQNTILIGAIVEQKSLQHFQKPAQEIKDRFRDDKPTPLELAFAALRTNKSQIISSDSWGEFIQKESDLKRISELQSQITLQEGRHIFHSRAGETRKEIIQFCDADHNPMELAVESAECEVIFSHKTFSFIAVKGVIELSSNKVYSVTWKPFVKGAYKMFINGQYIPLSDDHISVIAGTIDENQIKIEYPYQKAITYFDSIECQFYLKDKYGNIYSEFDKTQSKDTWAITIVTTADREELQVQETLSNITKLGKQSIVLLFNNSSAASGQISNEYNNAKIQFVTPQKKLLSTLEIQVQGVNFEKRRVVLYDNLNKYKKNMLSSTVKVRRDRFVEDILTVFEKIDLKNSIFVNFANEGGIDAGGLKREFYELVGKAMKDQIFKFFEPIKQASSEKYYFHPQCMNSKQSIPYFKLFGQFIAHTILYKFLLGVYFVEPLLKVMSNQEIVFDDLRYVLDESTFSNYEYLKVKVYLKLITFLNIYCFKQTLNENELEDTFQYFQVNSNGKMINLVPKGENKQVNKQNLEQFLELTAKYFVRDRFEGAILSMREGFESVFPIKDLSNLVKPYELVYLTCGIKEINGTLLQRLANYSGGNSILTNFFQRYLLESSSEMLVNFLKFTTGSSSIPFETSSKLLYINFVSSMAANRLPISHTCSHCIEVPHYKTFEQMKNKLDLAFSLGNEGFAFG